MNDNKCSNIQINICLGSKLRVIGGQTERARHCPIMSYTYSIRDRSGNSVIQENCQTLTYKEC